MPENGRLRFNSAFKGLRHCQRIQLSVLHDTACIIMHFVGVCYVEPENA
jgi:hypothetical protein